MNVLIVHAHPEKRSFNGALTDTAVRTLSEQGHTVVVSDLYAMDWNPSLAQREFPELAPDDFFNPAKEQEDAFANKSVCREVALEQGKVRAADLVIFQFPVWWFSMPAILKGWVDRVLSRGFAYASGRKYDTGMLKASAPCSASPLEQRTLYTLPMGSMGICITSSGLSIMESWLIPALQYFHLSPPGCQLKSRMISARHTSTNTPTA